MNNTEDSSVPLQKTPLYQSHISLGAKMAPFGGWLMPIQYEGILSEHAHTRQGVSVFDICHMGEFMLEADPIASGFDRAITRNIPAMPAGSCRYGFMLNERGGIIDDLIVYRMGKSSWMLVVNAATAPGDESYLRKCLSGKYTLENASARTGKLDVQGPQSQEALEDIFGPGIKKLAYYTFAEFTFGKERCIISRTGYTGELGYEIYIDAGSVAKAWEELLKDKRVRPAGLGCRDTLRLEMGYPLYGQDLDTAHTPLAAGFERFVDFSKDFIGKRALLDEKKNGPQERLVCFKAFSRRAPRHGYDIFNGDSRVGAVTSGSFSPSLSAGIGMGYIRGEHKAGTQLLIKGAGIEITAVIVEKPFYRAA